MEKLLVSIDGSSAARTQAAVVHAIQLWRRQPVAVHLLSVQPPVSDHVSVFLAQAELLRAQQDTGLGELAPAQALLEASGVPCTASVMVGPPAETIARAARELGCDTIVLGVEGGDAQATVLGSVAQQVRHIVGPASDCRVIGA